MPALPDDWQRGGVRGLRARGGFIVSEQWSGGQVTSATVQSTIGGTLRLRSYVPLRLAKAPKGTQLKVAEGDCPNPLFAPAAIREPLRSPELKDFQQRQLQKVYEYDIETVAGQSYTFAAAK